MEKISYTPASNIVNTIHHLSNDDRDDIYSTITQFLSTYQVRLSIYSTIEHYKKWLFIPCKRYRITVELINNELKLILKLSMIYDNVNKGYKDIITKLYHYLKTINTDISNPTLL